MNVDNFLVGDAIELKPLTLETVKDMVQMRHKTFLGFAEVEQNKGFIRPYVSFSTSQGQEMLRIMLFRVLEEIVESHNSQLIAHIQEELIDALNYMLSALMLDEKLFPENVISYLFHSKLDYFLSEDKRRFTCYPPNMMDVAKLTKFICGDLAETFRNRAWMNQTQQTYFHGWDQVVMVFECFMGIICASFEGWQNFYEMYVAKDMVLQFRLKSKY